MYGITLNENEFINTFSMTSSKCGEDSFKLIQNSNGLTFGTDAYLLYAYMRAFPSAVCADLGCGTGIISILAAKGRKFKKIFAVEIQKTFCETTNKNISVNNLDDSICVIEKNVCELTPSDLGTELDCVFSNPPYMKVTSGKRNVNDEKYIARHEVYADIDAFCKSAARILKFGGLFYVVYRCDRLSDLMVSLTKNGLEPKRMTLVYPYVDAEPCLALIEAKKGAKSSMFVTPPLIMYEKDRQNPKYTEELKYIYENGEFNEQYRTH